MYGGCLVVFHFFLFSDSPVNIFLPKANVAEQNTLVNTDIPISYEIHTFMAYTMYSFNSPTITNISMISQTGKTT